ncbi:2-oxoglutarate and iron-dependent oxygenase domain-containing protein [Microbispora sp. NBRC 16548]|uniref:isopenicillin N synthase family dioxygenase n=1 Tax=Microbispora sp. NBRC 16548 TaxID=3030994 RepID=UPI0024A5FE7A|nr:2-oxoglutarate and iron-dependent oxygenase domain-containing protein [Microbispora sp. NBRC 16548]GLX06620.1 2OG-Fe(II) oxygenase [Microbispora sp. NBRC 16548]
MTTASATQAIPLIDLSDLDDNAVQQTDTACREVGFVRLTGHGVSPDLIDRAFEVSRIFFDSPQRVKKACTRQGSFLGYHGPDTLRASTTSTGPRDRKATYAVGRELDEGERCTEFTPPNAWPAGMPEVRNTLSAYYEAMHHLSVRVSNLFALALGLPANHFRQSLHRHLSWLTSIDYPKGGRRLRPDQMRFGEHRDRGLLTILASSAEGLEVRGDDGCWYPVPADPHNLIVNVGSMLANWTGRRWVSPLHRVRPPLAGEGRRQSLVFFTNPNPATFLTPLPLPGTTELPLWAGPPRTVGDYLASMLSLYAHA